MSRICSRRLLAAGLRWSGGLGGLTITHSDRDETVLTGIVADQAALYGLVAKLRDLGLPLSAVNPVQEVSHERE